MVIGKGLPVYKESCVDLRFSVIIPAFNSEEYIGEALESALNQIDVSLEIIVVDDGSTDKTLTIVKSFGDSVRVICQENSGVAAARNKGAKAATGNILAFLDSDDIWLRDKLRVQSGKLKEGFGMVYSNRLNIGQIGDLPSIQSDLGKMPEGDIWEKLLLENTITTSSLVIRKNIFISLNGFRTDLSHAEDWDLWLKCAENNLVGYCPEPLIKYRCHQGSLSKNYTIMSQMREKVVAAALDTRRGRSLSSIKRHRAVAEAWSTSAWDAARWNDKRNALRFYGRAIWSWPINLGLWYNVARVICGRAC